MNYEEKYAQGKLNYSDLDEKPIKKDYKSEFNNLYNYDLNFQNQKSGFVFERERRDIFNNFINVNNLNPSNYQPDQQFTLFKNKIDLMNQDIDHLQKRLISIEKYSNENKKLSENFNTSFTIKNNDNLSKLETKLNNEISKIKSNEKDFKNDEFLNSIGTLRTLQTNNFKSSSNIKTTSNISKTPIRIETQSENSAYNKNSRNKIKKINNELSVKSNFTNKTIKTC